MDGELVHLGELYIYFLETTVKLGDKEQIGAEEPFPVTNCQFTS